MFIFFQPFKEKKCFFFKSFSSEFKFNIIKVDMGQYLSIDFFEEIQSTILCPGKHNKSENIDYWDVNRSLLNKLPKKTNDHTRRKI